MQICNFGNFGRLLQRWRHFGKVFGISVPKYFGIRLAHWILQASVERRERASGYSGSPACPAAASSVPQRPSRNSHLVFSLLQDLGWTTTQAQCTLSRSGLAPERLKTLIERESTLPRTRVGTCWLLLCGCLLKLPGRDTVSSGSAPLTGKFAGLV